MHTSSKFTHRAPLVFRIAPCLLHARVSWGRERRWILSRHGNGDDPAGRQLERLEGDEADYFTIPLWPAQFRANIGVDGSRRNSTGLYDNDLIAPEIRAFAFSQVVNLNSAGELSAFDTIKQIQVIPPDRLSPSRQFPGQPPDLATMFNF